MPVLFRRLALGLCLIAAASTLLMLSDLGSRTKKSAGPGAAPAPDAPRAKARVALLQHSSKFILDQLRESMLAGMDERGWTKDRDYDLAYFNAEGDMPVVQSIAQRMASGGHDLLLSISTPSLQAVATANRENRTPHLFAGVTQPSAAALEINTTDPLDHPTRLAGYGTLQSVGTLYNASKTNSEAQLKNARAACARLGLTLIETTVNNSAVVGDAANAPVASGAEALRACGYTTVLAAIDTTAAAARKGRVPLFTVIPPNAKKGTRYEIGAHYTEVGQLAGEVCSGTKKPAEIPIDNAVPKTLVINLRTLADLKYPAWSVPPELCAAASLLIDETGVDHKQTQAAAATESSPSTSKTITPATPNPSGKSWRIAIVFCNERVPDEETMADKRDAWVRSRFMHGRDYTLTLHIGSLCGIQSQSLPLLIATWMRPSILLIDEHTATQLPKGADQVIALSDKIVRREKLTTLMVTHSMQQALGFGDRIIMMHRGRVLHDIRGAEKRRLRTEDLLDRFEDVRRREQLDESAASLLHDLYV